jgi:DNA-binding transcriptional regulator LsrR (DeoR family)
VARSRLVEAHGHGPAWMVQAAVIARQFYLEGRSKVEIGDDLGLSRFKVARILEEARELGLVEVTVRLPALIDAEASTALGSHLEGVRAIVLASEPAPGQGVREDLGRLGAQVLTELLTDTDVLGLTCSRSVTAAVDALEQLAPCDVVQLTGTLAGHDAETGSVESVRRAAAAGGGRAHPIYSPMLLGDPATARSLAGESTISQTLRRIPEVTVAMLAVGSWSEGHSTVWTEASDAERQAGLDGGAVGEIGGRLFDAEGRAVTTSLDERVLGATLPDLARVPQVIALAHGAGRAEAARAAVLGGLASVLVCDRSLARRLLELPPATAASRTTSEPPTTDRPARSSR